MLQELMTTTDVETKPSDETQPPVEDPTTKASEETPVTPESPPPAETPPAETVPLPIFMDLKHELRDVKQEITALRATQAAPTLDVAAPAKAVPVEDPDPLIAYKAEYIKKASEAGETVAPQDIPLSAGILEMRDQWQQRQVATATEHQNEAVRVQAMNQARVKYTDAVLGTGLGFDTVITQGNAFLTEGDRLDIANAGVGSPEVAYERCFDRLVKSGTPQGVALQSLANARQQEVAAKNKPAPVPDTIPDVTKPVDTTATKPEAPPVDAVLQRRRPLFDQMGIEYGEPKQ